jgi:hypothetical protein
MATSGQTVMERKGAFHHKRECEIGIWLHRFRYGLSNAHFDLIYKSPQKSQGKINSDNQATVASPGCGNEIDLLVYHFDLKIPSDFVCDPTCT